MIKSLNKNIDFDSLPVDSFWSETPHKEIKMHKIHAYPAKFPSFVVQRSIEYARNNKLDVQTIADIFCGCGTTALEAKLNGLNFWGCDINPVATLIARAKSYKYNQTKLLDYFNQILNEFDQKNIKKYKDYSLMENERLIYWFDTKQRKELFLLLSSIKETVPLGKYNDFYLCAFSNILKGCSKWLTKSIKPQLDPNKTFTDVRDSFKKQVTFMVNASLESRNMLDRDSNINIINTNFLNYKIKKPFVDMVVTSPPYATSYEYADLHQLSSLWLGFTDDYRNLREGTIGSLYHNTITEKELNSLNGIGKDICYKLIALDSQKAKSVAKYFLDINKTVANTKKMLKPKGKIIFIVGNTQYKGVRVDNAKFLYYSLLNDGFKNIEVHKRKISFKSLTPYREKDGKFSSNSNNRKVYDYEFVIIADK